MLRLWASQDVFGSLEARCDSSHSHKPWQPRVVGKQLRSKTADESVYPTLLCQRLLSVIAARVNLPLLLSQEPASGLFLHDRGTRFGLATSWCRLWPSCGRVFALSVMFLPGRSA